MDLTEESLVAMFSEEFGWCRVKVMDLGQIIFSLPKPPAGSESVGKFKFFFEIPGMKGPVDLTMFDASGTKRTGHPLVTNAMPIYVTTLKDMTTVLDNAITIAAPAEIVGVSASAACRRVAGALLGRA